MKIKLENQPSRETRAFTMDEVRIRRGADKPPVIAGHAAVFEQLSEEMYGFREKIAKGAFSEAINRDDIRALFNHNPDHVLGRNRAGTLSLREDDKGLYIEIVPPDTQMARDLLVSIERGDITQMSFGFRVEEQAWEEKDNGDTVIRTIKKCSLFDVSPVTYPAYPQTDVAVRSLQEWRESKTPAAPQWKLDAMNRGHNLREAEAEF